MKAKKKTAKRVTTKVMVTKKTPKKKTPKKITALTKPELLKFVVDPDRAEAAAEVLQAVFLHEKHFDLESEVVLEYGRPIAHQDADGHLWITVKLHVPALDIDCWIDGTHMDHPDNQPDDEDCRESVRGR